MWLSQIIIKNENLLNLRTYMSKSEDIKENPSKSEHLQDKTRMSKAQKEQLKKLSPKEAQTFLALADNPSMSIKDAALQAGFSESSSKSTVYTALKNKAPLLMEFIRQSYGPDKVAKKFIDLTEAKKVISAIAGKDADGKSTDFVEVPDNKTQLEANKAIARLMGLEPAKEATIEHRSVRDEQQEMQEVQDILKGGGQVEIKILEKGVDWEEVQDNSSEEPESDSKGISDDPEGIEGGGV
jgi:DNA-binding MarR family transcriptional regulator